MAVRKQMAEFIEYRDSGGESVSEMIGTHADIRKTIDSRRPSLSELTTTEKAESGGEESNHDGASAGGGGGDDNDDDNDDDDDAAYLRAPAARGVRPMRWAARHGHLSLMQWLHVSGAAADVTAACDNGLTPMLVASAEGHVDVVRWLVANGARGDVRKADLGGSTPLLWACMSGHFAVAKVLVSSGAKDDLRVPNHAKLEPLAVAMNTCGRGGGGGGGDDDPDSSLLASASLSPSEDPLCQWLLLQGALSPRSPDEVDLVERAIAPADREPLLRWVEGVLDTQRTFMRTVLVGAAAEDSPSKLACLKGHDGVRELIADFDGVVRGEDMHHARVLKASLEALVVAASGEEEAAEAAEAETKEEEEEEDEGDDEEEKEEEEEEGLPANDKDPSAYATRGDESASPNSETGMYMDADDASTKSEDDSDWTSPPTVYHDAIDPIESERNSGTGVSPINGVRVRQRGRSRRPNADESPFDWLFCACAARPDD